MDETERLGKIAELRRLAEELGLNTRALDDSQLVQGGLLMCLPRIPVVPDLENSDPALRGHFPWDDGHFDGRRRPIYSPEDFGAFSERSPWDWTRQLGDTGLEDLLRWSSDEDIPGGPGSLYGTKKFPGDPGRFDRPSPHNLFLNKGKGAFGQVPHASVNVTVIMVDTATLLLLWIVLEKMQEMFKSGPSGSAESSAT